jgi:hypothetical protein
MEVFLNELSLHGQFQDVGLVVNAVESINRILFRVADIDCEKRLMYDTSLYYRVTTPDSIFSACLAHLPDKDVRRQFKILLEKASKWRDEPKQKACDYYCGGDNVSNTSVAEFFERHIGGVFGFLLNFGGSNFGGNHQVEMIKMQAAPVRIYSVTTLAHLEKWAEDYPQFGLGKYNPNSGRTPLDTETVLRDRGRFLRTKVKNHGRAVYLERETGLYFCVDNLHEFGAHLEVFDANGAHIGEANLEGVIDPSKVDASKEITL